MKIANLFFNFSLLTLGFWLVSILFTPENIANEKHKNIFEENGVFRAPAIVTKETRRISF